MDVLRQVERNKPPIVGVADPPELPVLETCPDEHPSIDSLSPMMIAGDAGICSQFAGHEFLQIESGNEDGNTNPASQDTGATLDVWEIEEVITESGFPDVSAPADLPPEENIDSGAAVAPVLELPAGQAKQVAPESGHEMEDVSDISVVPFMVITGASVETSKQASRTVFIAKSKHLRAVRRRRLLLMGLAAFAMLGATGFLLYPYPAMVKSTLPMVTGKRADAPAESVTSAEEAIVAESVSLPATSALSLVASIPESPVRQELRQDLPAEPEPEPGINLEPLPLSEYPAPSQPAAITITRRAQSPPQSDPLSAAAYAAYQRGSFDQSKRNYQLILQADPEHRGAMLGLAAIALRQNEAGLARDFYLRLLQQDPSDPLAKAGLMASMSTGDPAGMESELKLLIELHPDVAPLFFSLGNLYAAGRRWNEAQQAYFNALRVAGKAASQAQTVSPDYPFNLAVSLEHLDQSDLAITYYREALKLAADQPGGFDREALRLRLENFNRTNRNEP